jgi:hypothetical protein
VSRHQTLQALAPESEQQTRPLDTSDRPLQFERIPNVCLVADVCRILQMSERQFRYVMARQQLALVELPRWDRYRRFTGESVARVCRMRKV